MRSASRAATPSSRKKPPEGSLAHARRFGARQRAPNSSPSRRPAMTAADFAAYWHYHVPNFILAALIYTLIGRLILGLVAPENWDNYIWIAFQRLTDPFLAAVRFVTPALIGQHLVMIFAILWLMLARILLFAAMASLGLAPRIAG